jgi:FKBP-type peptidyl-prolyl cis-trans isomerase SlyD
MKIEKNSHVSLIYELREGNHQGRLIEALEATRPLTFIYGTGRLLHEFESRISFLGSGDSFSFVLNSEDAYGDRREDLIINIPLTLFEKEGKIDEEICRTGNEVPMVDSEGHPITGVICEIGDSYVKMDFNHPMAGIDLFFSGKIIDVRIASDEEIARTNNPCNSCSSHNNESGCVGSCSN